jgi:hypothetical protein
MFFSVRFRGLLALDYFRLGFDEQFELSARAASRSLSADSELVECLLEEQNDLFS